jgi:hypothetical protein
MEVVVLMDDKPARKGFENAARGQGYADAIIVYGLADIIGDDPGDSMRSINPLGAGQASLRVSTDPSQHGGSAPGGVGVQVCLGPPMP